MSMLQSRYGVSPIVVTKKHFETPQVCFETHHEKKVIYVLFSTHQQSDLLQIIDEYDVSLAKPSNIECNTETGFSLNSTFIGTNKDRIIEMFGSPIETSTISSAYNDKSRFLSYENSKEKRVSVTDYQVMRHVTHALVFELDTNGNVIAYTGYSGEEAF